MKFCAICVEPGDLVLSEDGFLECARCRDEHPRSGGYTFQSEAPGSEGTYRNGACSTSISGTGFTGTTYRRAR